MPNSKVVFFITNKGLNTILCCQILTAETKVYFFSKICYIKTWIKQGIRLVNSCKRIYLCHLIEIGDL